MKIVQNSNNQTKELLYRAQAEELVVIMHYLRGIEIYILVFWVKHVKQKNLKKVLKIR